MIMKMVRIVYDRTERKVGDQNRDDKKKKEGET